MISCEMAYLLFVEVTSWSGRTFSKGLKTLEICFHQVNNFEMVSINKHDIFDVLQPIYSRLIYSMCFPTRHLSLEYRFYFIESRWIFSTKYQCKYSINRERRKAHWIKLFCIHMVTSEAVLIPLTFENIRNSTTCWKEISKVFKP
jgi:hypothetical protein